MSTLAQAKVSVVDTGTGVSATAEVTLNVPGSAVPMKIILATGDLGLTAPQLAQLQTSMDLLRTRAVNVARGNMVLP